MDSHNDSKATPAPSTGTQPQPQAQKPWKLVQAPRRQDGPREVWVASLKRGTETKELTGTFDDVQKQVHRLTKE